MAQVAAIDRAHGLPTEVGGPLVLLVRELHELGELLATVDILEPEGQQAIGDAVFHLYEHISKEDGLFPASPTLSQRRRVGHGDGRVARGAPRQAHHPGVSGHFMHARFGATAWQEDGR